MQSVLHVGSITCKFYKRRGIFWIFWEGKKAKVSHWVKVRSRGLVHWKGDEMGAKIGSNGGRWGTRG